MNSNRVTSYLLGVVVFLTIRCYLLSLHVWLPPSSHSYWFVPFLVHLLVVLWCLQLLRWKGLMVVTCLKGWSPLFVHSTLSENSRITAVIVNRKDVIDREAFACGTQSDFKQLIRRSRAASRFGAVHHACNHSWHHQRSCQMRIFLWFPPGPPLCLKKELAQCVR